MESDIQRTSDTASQVVKLLLMNCASRRGGGAQMEYYLLAASVNLTQPNIVILSVKDNGCMRLN